MGISRSASCVISFIMKEYGNDLVSALNHTKERRSIVNPNKRFRKDLEIYAGILEARHHSVLFRSKSERSIPTIFDDQTNEEKIKERQRKVQTMPGTSNTIPDRTCIDNIVDSPR